MPVPAPPPPPIRRLGLLAVLLSLGLVLAACGSGDGETTVSASEPPAQSSDDGEVPATTEPVAEPSSTNEPAEAPADEPTVVPADDPTGEPVEASTPVTVATPTPPEEPLPMPVEVPLLADREWFVFSVEPADLGRPTGSVARIRFLADGTVSGNGGCNDFAATYAVDGSSLQISDFAITTPDRDCFIGDWTDFLDALPNVTGFGSAGGPDPLLFTSTGSTIVLASVPPSDSGEDSDDGPTPSTDGYVGLSEIEAAQLADSRGVLFRVSSIDGEPQMLTMDFVEDRVNVDLVDGIVVGVVLG